MAEGRYAAASAVLERSVADTPRAAQSLYLLGVANLMEGRLDESRARIDRAFEIKRWVRDITYDVADIEAAAKVAIDLMPDWAWPRYEVERRAFSAIGLTLDWVVRLQLAGDDVSFVQVGANDGAGSRDPIHKFVTEHQWSGVCVEPMPEAFQRLGVTYADHPRVRLANVAVDAEDGIRSMYLPADSDTTLASLLPDRNILAKSQDLKVVDVQCVSFSTLFAQHDISAVDILQIDTEGYDYQVLRSFDLARYRPLVVNLEMFCLPLDERLACFSLLRKHDYAYRYDGKDLIAVDRGTLGSELCAIDRTGGAWLPEH